MNGSSGTSTRSLRRHVRTPTMIANSSRVGTSPSWVVVAGIGIACSTAALVGMSMTFLGEALSPVWPPTGVGLAALLMFGIKRTWIGVSVAAVAVDLFMVATPLSALITAAGSTVALLVTARLLSVWGFRFSMDRLKDTTLFVGATLLGMLICATVRTASLTTFDPRYSNLLVTTWVVVFVSDVLGVLLITPLLLSWRSGHLPPIRLPRAIEAVALLTAVVLVSLYVGSSPVGGLYLVVPLIAICAWRFQHSLSNLAALIAVLIITWSASGEHGLFATMEGGQGWVRLQGFNATVALTSLLLSAVVAERINISRALSASASDLEARVLERTTELKRLRDEALRREQQLAQAQQVGQIGSWEWDIDSNTITWSDEMYRIYGYEPGAFTATFDGALSHLQPDDAERMRQTVERALDAGHDVELPTSELRMQREDGVERMVMSRARLQLEGPTRRMFGTVQDVTDLRRAEREHWVAESLQRSLLPEGLPDIPGVELSARYQPAAEDLEVGGDWYDVMQLSDGRVYLSIGDIAGHGLREATIMGQIRMAMRAYAERSESPSEILRRANTYMTRHIPGSMATALASYFDPETGVLTTASAGHLPPVVVGPEDELGGMRRASLMPMPASTPLGAVATLRELDDVSIPLQDGSTVLYFTDGVVEVPGVDLAESLADLAQMAGRFSTDGPEDLCEALMQSSLGGERRDDFAVMAIRATPYQPRLQLTLDNDSSSLAPFRRTVRRWLRRTELSETQIEEVILATGEVVTNAIQHPYGLREGKVDVDLRRLQPGVEITVTDHGTWRTPVDNDAGRGLQLARHLMELDVERGPDGTTARLRTRSA